MKRLSFLLFLAANIWASDKISMAITDFDATGVTPEIAASVADFIQDGLRQTGRFTVIERKNVQKLLKEQMFQKIGCTSTDCAVEIGKMLNVNNIVSGRVSQMGKRIVISLSLVDVEAGKISLTDSVECGSVELLNTGSQILAGHFSKGVAVKGKVIKVSGNDVIINLGMDDGVKNGDFLTVERFGEAVKDETGKIVFQEKSKIGTISVKDASTSGSKALVTEGDGNIKNSDVVELKIEKLRRLDPILSSVDSTTYTPPSYDTKGARAETRFKSAKAVNNDEELKFDLGVTMGFNGSLSFIRYTTNGSTISIPQTKIATFNNYLNFTLGFGSAVSEFMDIENMIQFTIPGFTDTSGTADSSRFFMLMSDGLMLKFYPLVGLLKPSVLKYKELGAYPKPIVGLSNPSVAKYSTPSQPRGDFQPYIALDGNLYLGLFEPDVAITRLKTDTVFVNVNSIFLLGFGLDLKAGIEVGNALYAEAFWRVLSTLEGNTDVANSTSKSKIGTQKYIFDLNTFGVGIGLKF